MIPTPEFIPAPPAKGGAFSSGGQSPENTGSVAKGRPFGDVLNSQESQSKKPAGAADPKSLPPQEGGKSSQAGGNSLPDKAASGQGAAPAIESGVESLPPETVSTEGVIESTEIAPNIAPVLETVGAEASETAVTEALEVVDVVEPEIIETTETAPQDLADLTESAEISGIPGASAIPALQRVLDSKIERTGDRQEPQSIHKLADILQRLQGAGGSSAIDSTLPAEVEGDLPEQVLPQQVARRDLNAMPGLKQASVNANGGALPLTSVDPDAVMQPGMGASDMDLIPGLQQALTAGKAAQAMESTEQFTRTDTGLQKTQPGNLAQSSFGTTLSSMTDMDGTPLLNTGTKMNAPMGSPGWNTEFFGRVNVMVKGGVQEASLQLSPPDLGRLEIKISTDGDLTRVMFAVDNPTAREAIEQAMPRLKEMLEQGGLELVQSEVADQSASNQGDEDTPELTGELASQVSEEQEDGEEMTASMAISASNSTVDYYI